MINHSFANSHKKLNLNSNINVTPFVDVMLVLLIVFMITSPMMVSNIKVDLPTTSSTSSSTEEEPITITITSSGKIYLQDSPILQKDIINKLNAITKENNQLTIYIKADQKISYGKMMDIMAMVNKSGYGRIGLITEMLN